MAEDKISTLHLRYEIDKRKLSEVVEGTTTLEERIKRVNKTVGEMGVATENNVSRFIQRLQEEQGEVRRMEGTVEDLRKAWLEQAAAEERAAKSAIANARAVRQEIEKTRDITEEYNDRFDEVSRRVALAGDAQSNLGALAGLTGAAGLTDVSSGIGIAGEVVVLVEELPRLKAAIAGLPAAASAAIQAIGAGTLLGGGALVAAIAGLALIAQESARRFEEAKQKQQEYIEQLKQETELRGEIRGLIATGDPDQVQAQIRALEIQREDAELERQRLARDQLALAQNEILPDARRIAEAAFAGTTPPGMTAEEAYPRAFEEALFEAVEELQNANGAFKQNKETIAELVDNIAKFDGEINRLKTDALAGAEAIARINEPIERGRQLRSIVQSSSTEAIDRQLDDLSEDFNNTVKALEQSEVELEAARASGNKAAEQQIVTQQAILEARLAEMQETGALLLEAKPLIEAREAETRAIERQREVIQAQIVLVEQRIAREIETAELLRTGTTDAIDERLAKLHEERQVLLANIDDLQALANTSDEAAGAFAAAQARLNAISGEMTMLSNVRPDVAMRQLREETEQLDASLVASIQRLTATRDSQLANLADKLQQGLADLDAEFAEQQAEQREEAQEQFEAFRKEEVNRAKEHQLRLLQISRDGGYAIEDAAADRNIRAALEAERSLKDRLSDEQTAFDRESDKRKEALEALKDNLSDQERERLRDYQKRYNSLIDQNRREVAAVNSKYQQEVSLQHQAYNQQLSALQQSLTSETSLRVQGYNSLIQAASSFANGLISIGQGMVNSLTGLGSTAPMNDGRNIITPDYVVLASGGGGGGASRVAQIPTFATGGQAVGLASVNDDPRRRLESGLARSGKLVFFTEPTTVLDGSRTRRLLEGDTSALPGGAAPRGGSNIINYQFGDIHVSVSGTNANPKQIAREVAVEIRNELQRRRA